MIVSRHTSFCSTAALAVLSGKTFLIPISEIRTRKCLCFSVCTGNLLAFIAGLTFGWSSPFLPKLKHDEHLANNPFGRVIDDNEASWIGSLLLLGGMMGTCITGYASRKLGRKGTMVWISSASLVSSYLILAYGKNIYLFYFARFIAGVGVSSVYRIVPMYLAEIADDEIRGIICCSMVSFETFGELVVYCVGPYVTIHSFSLITAVITVVIGAVILQCLPESPFYLLGIQKTQRAEKSLMLLRSDTREGIKLELEYIQDIIQESEHNQGRTFDLCKSKASRRAKITIIGLTIFQHFSGILPIVLYSQDIFNVTGSKLPAEFCTMSFGAVQFLSSFIAPSLVYKPGRRWMLLISATGMIISEFALGLYFYRKDNEMTVSVLFWLPVTSLLMFTVSYISGFGPLIWTIMSEMFPIHLKAAAFSIGLCIWWMTAFIVGAIFYPISNIIGMGGCFWMFASCCFCGTIFIWTYVIETKGKTLQEIQELLSK